DLRRLLLSGAKIRTLLLDPNNAELVKASARFRTLSPERLRKRIESTLDELRDLRDTTNGDLSIRISSFLPPFAVSLIDSGAADGMVVVQLYGYQPTGQATAFLVFRPEDGFWYSHFCSEAERMWTDSVSWSISEKSSSPGGAGFHEDGSHGTAGSE